MIENIVKIILNEYNGEIKKLLIPSEKTNGTGLCNPSIFVEDDKIHLILRHVEYTLYHSENEQKYQTKWEGPLSYYHRENCRDLKTNNYYCRLNENLNIVNNYLIDTTKLDVKPIWNFIGLEDARIVKWLGKYLICGVRRDTTTNGQGRMELSEIEIFEDKVNEIKRNRIEVPEKNSYCEKNWMPILDKPYHFIRWVNPVEMVKVNMDKNLSEVVLKSDIKQKLPYEIRGGSPLVRIDENRYLCITHEVNFIPKNHNGFKDPDYYHRFVLWDNDFNIIKISEQFNFMTAKIEFCIGLAFYKQDILIPFGFQDNCSFIIKINKDSLLDFIHNKL